MVRMSSGRWAMIVVAVAAILIASTFVVWNLSSTLQRAAPAGGDRTPQRHGRGRRHAKEDATHGDADAEAGYRAAAASSSRAPRVRPEVVPAARPSRRRPPRTSSPRRARLRLASWLRVPTQRHSPRCRTHCPSSAGRFWTRSPTSRMTRTIRPTATNYSNSGGGSGLVTGRITALAADAAGTSTRPAPMAASAFVHRWRRLDTDRRWPRPPVLGRARDRR